MDPLPQSSTGSSSLPGASLHGAHPWWRPLLLATPIDWLMQAYLLVLLLGLSASARTPTRDGLFLTVLGCIVGHAVMLTLAHARGEPRGWRRAMARVAPVGAIAVPYFRLREIIPTLNDRLYDTQLWHLDLRLFGTAPAAAVERWMSTPVVEWFSFSYALYWVVGIAFIVPALLTSDGGRGERFVTPLVLSLCLGHVLYVLVPAYGPWVAQTDAFAAPLAGGPIYDFMHQVASAGAQRDVFPSLHTAHMVLFSLYCWAGHRAWRPLAWPVTFAAANVIAATILLRWHYVVDVIAGIAFGVMVIHVGWMLNEWYADRRAEAGLSRSWW